MASQEFIEDLLVDLNEKSGGGLEAMFSLLVQKSPMVPDGRRLSCSGSTSSFRLDIKVADRTSILPNCL